jgi:hypothetical protein
MVSKKAARTQPDELTREEGWALLDDEARRYLGMSAEEFIRIWDAGGFPDVDTPEVIRVASKLRFVR